jgi:hypothetical protein
MSLIPIIATMTATINKTPAPPAAPAMIAIFDPSLGSEDDTDTVMLPVVALDDEVIVGNVAVMRMSSRAAPPTLFPQSIH